MMIIFERFSYIKDENNRVDVVEWSRALDVRLSEWCEFTSRRGKNKNLTAQKSNSNTVIIRSLS